MDFLIYVRERQQEIIDALKKLCQIPSLNEGYDENSETPFGAPIDKALKHMLDLGKKDGFIVKNVKNHAGHIEIGEGDELVGVLTHVDVVPATGEWKYSPFDATVKGDKIYGRGTSDDKGPTIAAYFAMKFLKELNVKFHKRVRLIMGTDEETQWRGIKKYFETEEMPTFGFSPDANFPLIHGEKGIYTFDVEGPYEDSPLLEFKSGERYNVVPDYAECKLLGNYKDAFKDFLKYHDYKGGIDGMTYYIHGKNAHAMTPNLGLNAAFILATFLSEQIENNFVHFIKDHLSFDPYGEKLGLDIKDPVMKNFTINPGIFHYTTEGAKIGINCRYPKDFNLKAAAQKISSKLKKYNLTYHLKQNVPLHLVKQDDPLIGHLMAAYRKITNDQENEPYTIGGGTFARALEKGVAFGMVMPGRKDVAHQVDEHIYIEDLIEGTAIYMEALHALTQKDVKI